MEKNFPKWLPKSYADYLVCIEEGFLDYPFDTVNTDLARSLSLDSPLHQVFWKRMGKLLNHDKAGKCSSHHLFTSLLLTIEHGLNLPLKSWDTKTIQARVHEINRWTKELESLNDSIQGLKPEQSAPWKKLRAQKGRTEEQQLAAASLERDLYGLTVSRPFIAPEFVEALSMQLDLMKSSLSQLDSEISTPNHKVRNLAPFNSNKPKDTYLIRCLAYWFKKQFGSPKYNILCDLVCIILNYPVSIDSVKSAVRESKALNEA
ncbi:hypothetical protein [Vibrio antiquarius]|uniref:hypothetical protein n=1 Tax=Vibrio antiquarius (strain Ex25) TaxID=150340 RepID=UPI0026593E50|nr:hypothetical protein [Vibrio antiquarius]MCS0024032.1 hypothetical protein [Vibrio antiquarius]